MPTKTEYREYIASPEWQNFRRRYLERYPFCSSCGISRSHAVFLLDQDLHVHHKNYLRVGREEDEDLCTLCRACHEIETFGNTELWSRSPAWNRVNFWMWLFRSHFGYQCNLAESKKAWKFVEAIEKSFGPEESRKLDERAIAILANSSARWPGIDTVLRIFGGYE